MNHLATNSDAIVLVKRSKITELFYEIIQSKIYHYKIETNTEKREDIENKILELIALLEEV